jgi:UDP-3-O-[3-hydroxymyristoyl] glucosamine N-acyltransferase
LAELVEGRVEGEPGIEITGVATLEEAAPGELSFLTHPRYRRAATMTRASALLVGPGESRLERPARLVAADPYFALVRLLELFHPRVPASPGVSPDARVSSDVELGEGVHVAPFAVLEAGSVLGRRVVVGAGAVVGRGSRIGEGTELRPGVVLYPGTELGCRCLIHAGVVIGADGFGFATSGGVHHKLPQVGRVVIGDDVEIGANSAVDRAMLGATSVGAGSKIDDLVMLAHGVRLGPGSLVAAQSGIAGSARIGARARLAGQSGIAGHLELGDDVVVAAKSAVLGDLGDGAFVAGIPAVDHRRWKRAQSVVAQLPELVRQLRRLREQVARLERRLAGEE